MNLNASIRLKKQKKLANTNDRRRAHQPSPLPAPATVAVLAASDTKQNASHKTTQNNYNTAAAKLHVNWNK